MYQFTIKFMCNNCSFSSFTLKGRKPESMGNCLFLYSIPSFPRATLTPLESIVTDFKSTLDESRTDLNFSKFPPPKDIEFHTHLQVTYVTN